MPAVRSNLQETVNRPGTAAGGRRRGSSPVIRFSALVVLIAGAVAAGHFLNAWSDPVAGLRGWMDRAGSAGPLLFVVLFLALNTVGVPLPVLAAAAGAAFGPISGATTAFVSLTVTACVQFLIARHVAGAQVRQRFGHRLIRMSQLLERRGVMAVAVMRVLPGPFSELNMVAGLTLLKLRDFMIGTMIGSAPKALAWSGLGALLF